jgi:predicted dehydrogenase
VGGAPPRRRRVRDHDVRHGRRGRADRRRLRPARRPKVFADKDGQGVATKVAVRPGRAHKAVVEHFVEKVRSGDFRRHDGSGAARLAHVVDACYLSAAEQREVRLGR